MGTENNVQVQWLLFQEKFLAIDKEFICVKQANQQIADSLKDIVSALESLENVNVTGDKLSSEVRSRIFKEIDRWNGDRHILDDTLEEIKHNILELSEILHSDIADNTSSYETIKEDLDKLTDKISLFGYDIKQSENDLRELKNAITNLTKSSSLKEALVILRGIDCRDSKTGDPLKIGSGDWLRWHTKRGFSGLFTTTIIAIVGLILFFIFYLFSPVSSVLHSTGH